MTNITDKIDNASTLSAEEFNSHNNELEQLVVESGQTLDLATVDQLRKAVSTFSRAMYCQDSSGTANVLTLSRPNSLTDINEYYDGMAVTFSTSNTNTGAATATVSGLASKQVRTIGDVAISAGDIKAGKLYTLVYFSSLNSGAGAFALLSQTDTALEINYATGKTTPIGADKLGIWDSVSSTLKSLSFTDLWTQLTSLYVGMTENQTIAGNKSFTGNLLQTGAGTFGFGTGSGGTVTQATSKSTGVTLNKDSGQITMNAAALASGATVSFAMSNTRIAASDTVEPTILDTSVTSTSNYQCWATVRNGTLSFNLKNNTAGSLSEAVVINFNIIKGATA